MWAQDAAKKTCQEWWMIGMDRERESRNSVLSAWLDDDDDDIYMYVFTKTIYHEHDATQGQCVCVHLCVCVCVCVCVFFIKVVNCWITHRNDLFIVMSAWAESARLLGWANNKRMVNQYTTNSSNSTPRVFNSKVFFLLDRCCVKLNIVGEWPMSSI